MAVSDPAVCKRVVDPKMGPHEPKHKKVAKKDTTPEIPAWSPTAVLIGPDVA